MLWQSTPRRLLLGLDGQRQENWDQVGDLLGARDESLMRKRVLCPENGLGLAPVRSWFVLAEPSVSRFEQLVRGFVPGDVHVSYQATMSSFYVR